MTMVSFVFYPTVQPPDLYLDWQVMNEIALHRGSSPHLNTIDIFVDGQHLTEAVVRGIATIFRPTTTKNEFSLTV